MQQEYIEVLKQGLEKKIQLLEAIHQKCDEQSVLLQLDSLTPEEFDENVEKKAALVEELLGLDRGFEQVYARVRDEIMVHQNIYQKDIQKMQSLISEIVTLSTSIQAKEAANKQLAEAKFAKIRKQIKEVKASKKAVDHYYQQMMRTNYVDPQFMDNKK